MTAPFLAKRTTVLAEIEGTYGVDATPAVGTDAVLTELPSVALDAKVLERNNSSFTLSNEEPKIGRKLWNASFVAEFKSSARVLDGVNSNPSELDAILRNCGFTPTYTVESSPPSSNDGFVIYAPVSDSFESCTYYVYYQDVLYKITGAFADFSLDFVAGEYPKMNVSVVGKYNVPTDSTPTAATYDGAFPVQAESLTLVLGSFAPVCRSFSIAMNNEIAERPDVNSAEGLKGLRIVSRRPTVTFRIEHELIATEDIYANLDAGTGYAVSFTHGSTAGQKILVTIPNLTLTNVTQVEDEGFIGLDVEGELSKASDAGNDEMTIKMF